MLGVANRNMTSIVPLWYTGIYHGFVNLGADIKINGPHYVGSQRHRGILCRCRQSALTIGMLKGEVGLAGLNALGLSHLCGQCAEGIRRFAVGVRYLNLVL